MNSVALRRTEVKLRIRKPTPKGIGIYSVGMQNPWMKLSHVGNRFGIVVERVADWRVMTPTTYGDKSRTSPMIAFLSIFTIFLIMDSISTSVKGI